MILTTAIIKGGTGKTTTAAALAQAAAADGKKVLTVDLDPQANLTAFLDAEQNNPGAFGLLHGADPADVIQTTEQGIDVIAASPDLSTEVTATGSAKRLQAALEPLKKVYDLIIIDTPPIMGELTFNALQAADRLLIPLEADSGSLQGLYQITDIARQIGRSNKGLKIAGTVITRYDGRPKLNKWMYDTIADKGREIGAPLLTAIRAGVAIKEAQSMQENLFQYAPQSNPAKDYEQLYRMITRED